MTGRKDGHLFNLKPQTMKVTKPGIYPEITIEQYHADKSWMSATGVKHAEKSMSEYRLYLDGYWDDISKPHFDFGNACELYLVDKVGFEDKVAVMPSHRWVEEALAEKPDLKVPKSSKTYKDLEKEFLGDNAGRYVVPENGDLSMEVIEILVARCKADPFISQLLPNITYQHSCYWVDKETGLQMKTRPDIAQVTKNVLINIKTTLDGSPDKFSRDLATLNYPLQACVEICGAEASGLIPKVDKYFWLVLEKNPPFNVTLYEFEEGDIRIVMDEYRSILSRVKRAAETNTWPGYNEFADNKYGILTAKIPAWYKMKSNN